MAGVFYSHWNNNICSTCICYVFIFIIIAIISTVALYYGKHHTHWSILIFIKFIPYFVFVRCSVAAILFAFRLFWWFPFIYYHTTMLLCRAYLRTSDPNEKLYTFCALTWPSDGHFVCQMVFRYLDYLKWFFRLEGHIWKPYIWQMPE